MQIDWFSQESNLLLNPRLPAEEALLWQSIDLSAYPGHLWLTTSGSTQKKLVGLHKKAILASALAVNNHLKATSADSWIHPLPYFHVGGLGIWARAFLSGAKVQIYSDKWSPHQFQEKIYASDVTLTALVPTQVYDLVIQNVPAPKCLRAVVVGGGALQRSLYSRARRLGWPLLPSYGLTECASQVATASLTSLEQDIYPDMEILSHVEIKIAESGQIKIKSPSLLTTYVLMDKNKIHFSCPLNDGWLLTQDIGVLKENTLSLTGRQGDFVKIGGESVEMGNLESILEEIKLQNALDFDVALAAVPDERLGHVIHLFSTQPQTDFIQQQYDSRVLPFERIRKVHIVPHIPRSPLHKVLKNELLSQSFSASRIVAIPP